jgi:molybdopterin-binding protein
MARDRMPPEMLTAAEAASMLRLHVKRVQALARSGELPAVRTGRKWLFPRVELLGSLRSSSPRGKRRPGRARAIARETLPAIEVSARNQLRGRVSSIIADGVMAEVHIAIGDQELVSIITRTAAERLGLTEGDDVLAVIKSTEVMVAKVATGRRS